MIYYTKAHRGHLRKLLPTLRHIDIYECRAVYGISIDDGLDYSLDHAKEAYTILDGSIPIAMFGVTGGNAWLVGSPSLNRCFRRISPQAKRMWRGFVERYGELSNIMLRDNHVHIRWVEWLGAQFEDVPGKPHLVRFTTCV